MKNFRAPLWRLTALAMAVSTLGVPAALAGAPTPAAHAAAPGAELPDPLDRGDYTPATIQETKLGLVALQEPASDGSAPST